MNRLIAERIINALESGVVPIDDIQHFNMGRQKEYLCLVDLLNATKKGESEIMFVHGDYGVGKTHILGLMKKKAHDMNFIVSYVSLSSRECPLSEMVWVYSSILSNLTYRDTEKPTSLISFLDLWLDLVEKKILPFKKHRCKHGLTYETCALGCIDDLYKKHIPELEKMYGDLRNAVKLYQYAFLRHDERLKEIIVRWILGSKLTRSDRARMNSQLASFSVQRNIDSDSIFEMFRNIASFSKILGFKGFLILLDEAESIPSIHNSMVGYINLINLIMRSINMPRVCVIYATTPQFYDDAKRNFKYLENENTKEYLGLIYKRMEEKRINLEALNPEDLVLLANKILNIYIVSIQLENFIDQDKVWHEIENDITLLCQNTNTMREFIVKTVPIIKQHVSLYTV